MSGGGRAVPARALKAVTPAPIEEREADRLDVRVSQGRLHAAHVRAVAQAVAEFHHSPDCAPGDASGEAPTPAGIMRQARSSCERFAERATTLGLASIDVERGIGSLARLQRERLAWLLPRLESVRLRRRHATLCCARAWVDDDLRARVDPGPGSSARNDVLDVAEDLAGLFVDLSNRGASSAGRTLLGEYALRTDDYSLFRVIGLYAPEAACQLASAAIEFAGDCTSERERAEALVALALRSGWLRRVFRCASRTGRQFMRDRRRATVGSESGVSDRLSIPDATRNSANSGWSLGACPQIPTGRPAA